MSSTATKPERGEPEGPAAEVPEAVAAMTPAQAYRAGFREGDRSARAELDSAYQELARASHERVRVRNNLARTAAIWVETAGEAYKGEESELMDSIDAAARYVRAVFRDEAYRLEQESDADPT